MSAAMPVAADHAALRGWDECLRVDATGLWWLQRDAESGRSHLRSASADGRPRPPEDAGQDIRSEVQGYGGGAFCLCEGVVAAVQGDDGAVHAMRPGEPPRAISRPGPCTHGDLAYDRHRRAVVCVRETLSDDPAARITEIVALPLDGSQACRVLAGTPGFLASPRVSPCGRYLAWIRWDFPAMPWDQSVLEVVALGEGDAPPVPIHRMGRPGVSVIEPLWADDGTLYVLDDASGWWNPVAWRPGDPPRAVLRDALEFGFPPYMLGIRSHAVAPASAGRPATWLGVAWRAGSPVCVALEPGSGRRRELALPFEEVRGLQFHQGFFWFAGVSADEPACIVRLEPGTWAWTRVHSLLPPPAWRAVAAVPVAFTARDGMRLHAHAYVPPGGDAPRGHPLVVNVHGGPTGIATRAFDPTAQFWVRAGFAYLEVNHRGSSGFGRAYREALNGHWGVADASDCVDAVDHLCELLPIDARRVFIRGNSAGGFTVLRALGAHRRFTAGACYYGVSDLARLCTHTHKFESQYTFSLLGPYPARGALYEERSPLSQPRRLSAPVIFFQGGRDRIVEPSQTRNLARAMQARQLPSAYVEFPDEGHGFRKSRNFAQALEMERLFYAASHAAAGASSTRAPIGA
ncbi:prolyl oligopeptidase family serine peptidase [Ramlibacter sp.]|uniref:alpha/beta hydrolase family protein n=1 Tax=Ramlibacter sp. TaxID=1917967 RepID=UPI00181E1A9F|nr:prolyl oligopeptidase family serine peptidase [Ramlibacter sp.]MBA2675454.1 S9 family peptidase [Ramlibacter sp.]